MKVNVYTCSWSAIGMRDPQHYKTNEALRSDVEYFFSKKMEWKRWRVDYAYSCPNAENLFCRGDRLEDHWGEHYEMIDRIVTTNWCKTLLNHAKQDIMEARSKESEDAINMVVICQAGIHRSVAFSKILSA